MVKVPLPHTLFPKTLGKRGGINKNNKFITTVSCVDYYQLKITTKKRANLPSFFDAIKRIRKCHM